MSSNKVNYEVKISIPTFEDNGKDVHLSECVNVDKYIELLQELEEKHTQGAITDEEYKFLKLCSTRWIQFNYENVAQFFIHTSPEMKRLLQRNCMVLIDKDDAFLNNVVFAHNYIKNRCNEFLENRLDGVSENLNDYVNTDLEKLSNEK